MLKINKAYTDFVKKINIGERAYFIKLDDNGYDEKVENVAVDASSFSLIYIYGNDEPLKQNNKVAELCKQIQKNNPYSKIILETNGLIRPINFNTIKNIDYFVFTKSKSSGLKFDERVNENAWKWLAKAGAKFIFPVDDENDLDEINTIISGLMIKKQQIYININSDNYNKLLLMVKTFGFNIYMEFDGDWIVKDE